MVLLALLLFTASDESMLRDKLRAGTGVIELPAGVVEVASEITIAAGAHDLEIRGARTGTVLRATTTFQGRAILAIRGGRNIKFTKFEVAGNRAALAKPAGGLVAENVQGLVISDLAMREIGGFAVLVSHSAKVHIEKIDIQDSSSGGVSVEDGTTDFEVLNCAVKKVEGVGISVRSAAGSARNARGRIAGNNFADVLRGAIQVGSSTEVRVENNTGERIGFPAGKVDPNSAGLRVSGDTDKSSFTANRFAEINGRCIDLVGFQDGEIRGNSCENHQPPEAYKYGSFGIAMNNARNVTLADNMIDGTVFGGMLITGTGNRVIHNRLLNINMAHKDQPAAERSGIYLGGAVNRDNSIEDNEIIGFRMGRHCVNSAPEIAATANKVARNNCSDDATVNARNSMYQFPVRRVF